MHETKMYGQKCFFLVENPLIGLMAGGPQPPRPPLGPDLLQRWIFRHLGPLLDLDLIGLYLDVHCQSAIFQLFGFKLTTDN